MPIKINELIIQVKVYEANKKIDVPKHAAGDLLWNTEQQKLALTKGFSNLLAERETR
ncbi:hypothetical protein [Cardinium endosymbiont of Culicoides punctatus]|uniref:hypothetical protein n=1 Tax=Cardinium endosymbiont of Culicoides punctatus TaxID=2304601 RepID=UPI0010F19DB8|nr:hypothetical protein [Cardinium endosymbiont of Culicoides punctatus]TDG95296.1 hypothetical protein CCPUN_05500 [Cardinium endosymbiont of Culicoides punctatus]